MSHVCTSVRCTRPYVAAFRCRSPYAAVCHCMSASSVCKSATPPKDMPRCQCGRRGIISKVMQLLIPTLYKFMKQFDMFTSSSLTTIHHETYNAHVHNLARFARLWREQVAPRFSANLRNSPHNFTRDAQRNVKTLARETPYRVALPRLIQFTRFLNSLICVF